jgi:hypothetical protein
MFVVVRHRVSKSALYGHFLRVLSFYARHRPLQSGSIARAHARVQLKARGDRHGAENLVSNFADDAAQTRLRTSTKLPPILSVPLSHDGHLRDDRRDEEHGGPGGSVMPRIRLIEPPVECSHKAVAAS